MIFTPTSDWYDITEQTLQPVVKSRKNDKVPLSRLSYDTVTWLPLSWIEDVVVL